MINNQGRLHVLEGYMENMMISFIQREPVNPAVKQYILYSEVKIFFNIFFLPNRIC